MSILKKVMKQIFQMEKPEDRHIFDLWNEVSAFAVMGLPVSISKNTVERNEAGSPQESGLFRRSIGSPKGQFPYFLISNQDIVSVKFRAKCRLRPCSKYHIPS